MLELRLLGNPQISFNGQDVHGLTALKSQALLFYLASKKGSLSRVSLAGLLWADKGDDEARVNLRQAVRQIRKVLPDVIVTSREALAVNSDDLWLDVEQFVRLSENDSVESLQELTELYRGNFLEGFYVDNAPEFEAWQLLEQERLRLLALDALTSLCEHFTQLRELNLAVQYAQRLFALEPFQESTTRLLMRLFTLQDKFNLALAQYQTYYKQIQFELGLDPSEETQILFERIQKIRNSSRSNLPGVQTSLVGRQLELAELSALLKESEIRLLTLLGPGGTGKTRLALALAEAQIKVFLEGVFWVDLAAISNASQLPLVMARALGVRVSGQQSELDALVHYLKPKETLLILDNFETVMGGAIHLVDLLARCPHLKLLVTSREKLQLEEEWVYRLDGLGFPAQNLDEFSLEEAQTFDAALFFEQRAKKSDRRFSMNKETFQSVLSICQRLEGLPLGIELSAAWVDSVPVETLARDLAESLDLLQAQTLNPLKRHESMRVVFEHSWQKLTADEQDMLIKLAVFVGNFDQSAAEGIVQIPVSILERLASKSLLQVSNGGHYSCHPVVYEYSFELLQKHPELEALQHKHSDYYLEKTEAADKILDAAVEADVLAQLDFDYSNIRSALERSLTETNQSLCHRYLKALRIYWDLRSYWPEAQNYYQRVIHSFYPDHNPEGAQIYHEYGWCLYRLGQYEKALKQFDTCIQLAKELNNRILVADALNRVATIENVTGKHDEALEHFQESIAIYREADDKHGYSVVLNNLFILMRDMGDYEGAFKYCLHSLEITRELNEVSGAAMTLNNLGLLAHETGDYEKARAFHKESLEIRTSLKETWGVANSHGSLAWMALSEENYIEAKTHASEALRLATRIQNQFIMYYGHAHLASAETGLGDKQAALEHFKEALNLSQELDAKQESLICLERLVLHFVHFDYHLEKANIILQAASHLRERYKTVRPKGEQSLEKARGYLSKNVPAAELTQAAVKAQGFSLFDTFMFAASIIDSVFLEEK